MFSLGSALKCSNLCALIQHELTLHMLRRGQQRVAVSSPAHQRKQRAHGTHQQPAPGRRKGEAREVLWCPGACSWGPQSGCSRTLEGGPPDGICLVVTWVHCPLVSSKFVVVSGCVAYLLPAFPNHSAVLMPSVSGGGNTPTGQRPARLEKQRF